MNPKFIRVYKKIDIDDIKEHLMIVGDLSASCSKCNHMGIKIEMSQCPECNAAFRYIGFRNVKENMPKMLKLGESRPELIFIDFDDFKRMTGAVRAQEFFK